MNATARTMRKHRCACRYPGCGKKFDYTNLRGRHESMVHGKVWNGHQQAVAPPAVTEAEKDAKAHVQQALDQLTERQESVQRLIVGLEEFVGLEELRRESEDIERQKSILIETLAKLAPEPAA